MNGKFQTAKITYESKVHSNKIKVKNKFAEKIILISTVQGTSTYQSTICLLVFHKAAFSASLVKCILEFHKILQIYSTLSIQHIIDTHTFMYRYVWPEPMIHFLPANMHHIAFIYGIYKSICDHLTIKIVF